MLIDHVIHNVFQIHSTSVNIKEQNIHIIIYNSGFTLLAVALHGTAESGEGSKID